MDRNVVEQFAAGGPRLRDAVAGLPPADLRATPGPGDWSIQQLVIHLADSDAVLIDRMKRILTEDDPPLLNFDESAYVARLACDDQSVEDALLLFEVGRRQFARVLRRLPDDAFARFGTHNLRGRVSTADIVAAAVAHLDHHLKFLLAKRERLGKPLK